jgi:hypothetical protein
MSDSQREMPLAVSQSGVLAAHNAGAIHDFGIARFPESCRT